MINLQFINVSRRINSLFLLMTLVILYSCNNHQAPNNKSSENGKLISELTNPNKEILPGLILQNFKGKVVYVDIWATWCRPCLAEAPYSKTLQDKFAGKDIAFVNICCASKPETWEKTIHDYAIPGEHHLLNDEQCINLKEKYQLVSFPTYLLFDKSGNLIDGNAPRPSSDQITSVLNGLLDK